MTKLEKVVAFSHPGSPLRRCPRDTELPPFPQLDGTWLRAAGRGGRKVHPRERAGTRVDSPRAETRAGWAEQRDSQRCPDPPQPLWGSLAPRLASRTRTQGLSPLSGPDATATGTQAPGAGAALHRGPEARRDHCPRGAWRRCSGTGPALRPPAWKALPDAPAPLLRAAPSLRAPGGSGAGTSPGRVHGGERADKRRLAAHTQALAEPDGGCRAGRAGTRPAHAHCGPGPD